MPPRRKLDLEKIRAALNVRCPHCSVDLAPSERVRLDFEHLQCTKCGQTFTSAPQGTVLSKSKCPVFVADEMSGLG